MAFVFEGFDETPNGQSKNSGKFVFEGFEEPKKEGENAGRFAAQSAIGLGKGAAFASPAGGPLALAELAFPGAVQSVIADLLESDIEQQQMFPGEFPALTREGLEQGAQKAQEKYLGGKGLVEGLISAPFRAAGIETEPQTPAEKAVHGVSELLGLFKSGKATKEAIGAALGGEATRETLKELGVPEWLSDVIGIGTGAGISGIKPSVKAEKKLPSGLTQPKAVEAKVPARGKITKAQQQIAINKLDEQASSLFKKKAEEHIPLKKQIEEGHDFTSDFEKRFSSLEKVAKDANPHINTGPLNKFLREEAVKFKGIPHLDKEAASIVKEVKAYSKNPKTDLGDLYNIIRSNNRKQRTIFEKSRLNGTQKEYSNFLSSMNRKIEESIGETLPENSSWFKEHKKLNADYSQWKKSQNALSQLKGVLGEDINPASVRKLANDSKAQKKLSLSVGEEGAKEITQIAQDMDKAVRAIKKIPVRDWSKWEKSIPFHLLLNLASPGLGTAAAGVSGAFKSVELARRAYGTILLSPEKRKLYSEALKAIESQDMQKYLLVTDKLAKELSTKESQ